MERHVEGEMAAVGWLDGSSGRFSGDIEGLYEGYRWGDLEAERRVVEFAHGSVALVMKHLHASRGRPRGDNPFADGATPPTMSRGPGMSGPGIGRPPGSGSPGGAPAAIQASAMPALMADRPIRQTQFIMEIDGEQSTGIYAGASGDVTLTVPNRKDAGYLVVATPDGDLRLSFLEWSEGPNLVADLWVDGTKSTGVYAGASGELTFSLGIDAGKGIAVGPYSGTIRIEESS